MELRFTLPQRTTDGLPLRGTRVEATLCRGLERDPCVVVQSTRHDLDLTDADGSPAVLPWRDELPAELATGIERPLIYRVRLANSRGAASDWSGPAYTVAGGAPASVVGFRTEGTPKGVLMRWAPDARSSTASSPSEVLVRREEITVPGTSQKRRATAPVWLATHAEEPTEGLGQSIDSSAQEDTPYRYVAVRRRFIQLGERKLEIRSEESPPVQFALHDTFAPPPPTGLSAAGFREGGRFGVDLIWNPVEDRTVAGYAVWRQRIDGAGAPAGSPERLNGSPVTVPAFHDVTADPAAQYRYNVRAVNASGRESAAATVLLSPSSAP